MTTILNDYFEALERIINNTTTPGPPLKTAPPKLLKLPAPKIAAMPKKVKSLTVKTLFKPDEWPSSLLAESANILSIFFVLNKELDIVQLF